MADNKMSPEGTELQENIDTPERADGKSTETEEVKSKTRQKLEKLMMTAGVIAILVAPGAGVAAKEKLNNWGNLKDKISDLESGEQIQLKMTQEKLDELKPKIQDMGVTIKKKENNVVVIENPSFDDMFGGMEEDAEEKVEEQKKETAESEEKLSESEEKLSESEEKLSESEEKLSESEEKLVKSLEELNKQMKETAKVVEKDMEMVLATVEEKDVKVEIVNDMQNLLDKAQNKEKITNQDLNEIINKLNLLNEKNGKFSQQNKKGLDIIMRYIKLYVDGSENEKQINDNIKQIRKKIKQGNKKGIG